MEQPLDIVLASKLAKASVTVRGALTGASSDAIYSGAAPLGSLLPAVTVATAQICLGWRWQSA